MWMFNDIVKNLMRKGDQAINRVIKNLNFIHFSVLELDSSSLDRSLNLTKCLLVRLAKVRPLQAKAKHRRIYVGKH